MKPSNEEGRRLASQREDLIAQGADPADLLVPLAPTTADDTRAGEVAAEEVEAKVWPDDYGWGDLIALLDEHWSADIFGGTDTPPPRDGNHLADAGPRIVALIRWVDQLTAERDRLAAGVRKLADIADDLEWYIAWVNRDRLNEPLVEQRRIDRARGEAYRKTLPEIGRTYESLTFTLAFLRALLGPADDGEVAPESTDRLLEAPEGAQGPDTGGSAGPVGGL